jgi:glucose-6-phosphate isomerase
MIRFSTLKEISAASRKSAQLGWSQLLDRSDLGFWQLPERDENWQVADDLGRKLRKSSDELVVIGMGGSALGGRCLVECLATTPNVQFLFNTDPQAVEQFFNKPGRVEKSHFLLISKSGNTLELQCLAEILVSKLKNKKRDLKTAITVITEEKSNALSNWAKANDLNIAPHPQDVGGRFSGLSPVGLTPASFAGVDLKALRQGAQSALKNEKLVTEISAFYLDSFARNESISVFWSYVDRLSQWQPWLVQLWAESLAKKLNRKGQPAPNVSTPVGYLGTCDQHSVLQQLMEGSADKAICFVRSRELSTSGDVLSGQGLQGFEYLKGQTLGAVFHTQSVSTEQALQEAGRTTANIEIEKLDAQTLGGLMLLFELVIGVLGEALDINAFDQPGVELGKKITKETLQKSSRH